jgi:signal transduction histidine kinase
MSFFATVALINTISSAILGWVVFARNKKGEVNKTFFYYSIAITLWSACYFVWQISHTAEESLFWCKALTLWATLIPILYARFVYKLLGKKENLYVLILFYMISGVFLYLTFGNLLVSTVEPREGFSYWPVAGKAYIYYLVIWFAVVIQSVYLLFREFLKSTGSKKTQLCYILVGTIIGYAGGATNYPLWFNIHILPWGNILITFYAIAVSYAIIKFKLLNIKIIYTEGLVIAIFFGLLIDAILTTNVNQFAFRFLFVIIFSFLALKLIKSITQLEAARSNLEKDKEELIQLDLMKDEFMMMATHELTTPVTAIRGKLSMAVEENMVHLDAEQKEFFTPVLNAANRLNHTSRELVNATLINQHKFVINPEAGDLNAFIDEIVTKHKDDATANGSKLHFLAKHTANNISFDKKMINEVVSNLIDNAIHFTKNGEINVITKLDDDNHKLLLVSVSDTGSGIDGEAYKNLFNKFTQTGRFDPLAPTEQQGAGLGLYISKKIIQLHGGKIWCESEKDKGSIFSFSLPIS